MPQPRDPAVTEYIRMRLRELLNSPEAPTQEQIARTVGVSPAYISTVFKTGVGGRSIDGFARLFRLGDADNLRRIAYEWHLRQEPAMSDLAQEEAVVEAVSTVQGMHPTISNDQIRTILHRFTDRAFRGRDEAFWVNALLEEIKQDYLRMQRHKTGLQTQARERSRERTKIEGAYREAAKIKRERDAKPVEGPPTEHRLPKVRG